MKDPDKIVIRKRQAEQIARLLSASYNAMTDTPDAPAGIDGEQWEKVIEAINQDGWRVLDKHGFENPPTVPQIIDHVLNRPA